MADQSSQQTNYDPRQPPYDTRYCSHTFKAGQTLYVYGVAVTFSQIGRGEVQVGMRMSTGAKFDINRLTIAAG